MVSIRQLARDAMTAGYLSVADEKQLRQCLSQKYTWEDFQAFLQLQQAAMQGKVRQESRELLRSK
jgi:hypothetical protein